MPDPLQVKRVVKTLGMVNVEPAAINQLECVQVLVTFKLKGALKGALSITGLLRKEIL